MARAKTAADLDAFADKVQPRRGGVPCWVCSLPEREWLEKAKRDGRPFNVMQQTLIKACGYPQALVTRNKLDHHFREHMEAR